jgi:hypothetical protein
MRVAALSTTFEPAVLKGVRNFSFRGCIRWPTGDPPGPAVPPYAARRRFARRLSVHSGRSGERGVPTLSTLNI